MTPTYRRFYALIKEIPKGRVATYGQIARLAGLPRHARQVGYALNSVPAELGVPWQRVVNSQGKISRRAEFFFEDEQRKLLKREGVVFGAGGQISLTRFQWKPDWKKKQ